jgi:hypothetical protein
VSTTLLRRKLPELLGQADLQWGGALTGTHDADDWLAAFHGA